MIRRAAIAAAGVAGMVLGPLAVQSLADSASTGCISFYNDGTYEGSLAAIIIDESAGKAYGYAYTYGHDDGDSCFAEKSGYHVEAGSFHFRWVSSGWAGCDIGYQSQTDGGAYSGTDCTDSSQELLRHGHSFWVTGTRHDSGYRDLILYN